MTSLKGESVPRRACRFTSIAGGDDSFRFGFLQISLSSHSLQGLSKKRTKKSLSLFFFLRNGCIEQMKSD